jgi:hypothetical protein
MGRANIPVSMMMISDLIWRFKAVFSFSDILLRFLLFIYIIHFNIQHASSFGWLVGWLVGWVGLVI